jgi:TatD DNase family protein
MSKIKYVDIHSHVNFKDFDNDRVHVIQRAEENGVGMITVGTDVQTSKSAIKLAEDNENIWATVGIHPTEKVSFKGIEELAKHEKVLAIGECGLDYYHSEPGDIEGQRNLFIEHIELANSLNKPLMLHVRNGKNGVDAYLDALEILKTHSKVGANFHFFSGTREDLTAIIDAGYQVSFTGVITFSIDYDDLVRRTPADKIMIETDCPFAAPTPYRGKRNEPSYVIEMAKAVARIRNEDEEKVRLQLLENTKKFFKIN